jgi:rhodanese-related sulfurtransferase
MSESVRTVDSDEARRLVEESRVLVLDVRTAAEYERLGHIPGAILLPVDLMAAGLATLPRDGREILVCCEHGVRSAHAAHLLARAGVPGVLNMAGGMSRWRGARAHDPGNPCVPYGPSSWLLANAARLPRDGRCLDLACGGGRHALLLASAGIAVHAIDNDRAKLAALAEIAGRLGVPVTTQALDLEADAVDLGHQAYEAIVVFSFLHRPLFPAIRAALRPGGLLLYETFLARQASLGHPTSPEHLLEPGELRRLVAPLAIVAEREGEFDGRFVSGVAATTATGGSAAAR